jgi:SAM-dependent methyltransferase
MLVAAREAARNEPADVRSRLQFEEADLLQLPNPSRSAFDVVCCHGVAMYLPSLEDVVDALLGAACSGGIISLVTRNRFGIAMRAGMSRDWRGAVPAFDARTYTNRLGIRSVRADEPAEVQDAFAGRGATVLAWYGVRLFTDHWGMDDPGEEFPALLEAEAEAGRRDPYRSVAALTNTVVTAP